MNITLTGASGFLGSMLMTRLLEGGHRLTVLGRRRGQGWPDGVGFFAWNAGAEEPPEASLAGADAVINLAGEPVAQRWTPEVKRRLRASRVEGTRSLTHALSTISRRPRVLVNASAIGIYGSRGDEALTESSAPGDGFLAELTADWEGAADLAQALGMRVAKIRFGIVLGAGGGALARMVAPFRLGLGGRLGSGKQWMSWVHADDVAGLILFALENPAASGALNAASPNPVTNAEFTAELARALHRPAFLPVPALALKALFGEMATVLLASQRALPAAAEAAGFRFEYAELRQALGSVLREGKPI